MENKANTSKQKMFLVPFILMVVIWLILFIPAGSLHYTAGWIFWAGFTLITIFIGIYFGKKDPALLARRTKRQEKGTTKKSPVWFNLYFLGFILPGLDFRFHWSSIDFWIVVVANIIALSGYLFIFFVFKENSFASTAIQIEKEQRVITSGPYSIVRHPMYLGMVIISLFMPLALGSLWAIIPMLLVIPINVFRIKVEEEMLLTGLEGYKEYCEKVRYRMIPFIW
jgi:protein-S-isoprenylcysteine O-methyltransferase Ste14